MAKPFWDKRYGKDALCPITHTRLRPGINKHGLPYIITIDCNHSFYRQALLEWYKTKDTCPVCRKTIQILKYF
jgi:hypothetical protein